MRMTKNYLKVDFYRLFRSPQFYIAGAGVFIVYMVSSLQSVGSTNVFNLYWFVKFFSMIIVLFACSNFAYANSLLEDWEHGFYQSAVLRGSLKSYICAKVICCFFASVFSVILGTLYFVFVECFRIPLVEPADLDSMVEIVSNQDMFGCFINERWILLYFLLSSMLIGFLAGILALSAMWLSLVAKNKMFSVCIPVVGYYFLVNYTDEDIISFNGLFLYSGNNMSEPVLSFLFAVFVSVCFSALFGILIYFSAKRRMRGGKK